MKKKKRERQRVRETVYALTWQIGAERIATRKAELSEEFVRLWTRARRSARAVQSRRSDAVQRTAAAAPR